MSPRFVILFYGAMTLLATAWAFGRHLLEHWVQRATLPFDVALGGMAGLAIVGLSRLLLYVPSVDSLSLEMGALLGPLTWRRSALYALCSGVGEEALFRGVVQLELVRFGSGDWAATAQPWLGIGVASTLFAAMHIGPGRRYLLWTAFAWVVGLLFGSLFWWRTSLVAPILAHFTVNALNLRHLSERALDHSSEREATSRPSISGLSASEPEQT